MFYVNIYDIYSSEDDEIPVIDEVHWDDFKTAMVETFMQFPSVEETDEWIGRENHVLAKNRLAKFGISEYCGLVSVWAVPNEETYNQYGDYINLEHFSRNWLTKSWPKVENRWPNRYEKQGTFSNGESVYRKVNTEHEN